MRPEAITHQSVEQDPLKDSSCLNGKGRKGTSEREKESGGEWMEEKPAICESQWIGFRGYSTYFTISITAMKSRGMSQEVLNKNMFLPQSSGEIRPPRPLNHHVALSLLTHHPTMGMEQGSITKRTPFFQHNSFIVPCFVHPVSLLRYSYRHMLSCGHIASRINWYLF